MKPKQRRAIWAKRKENRVADEAFANVEKYRKVVANDRMGKLGFNTIAKIINKTYRRNHLEKSIPENLRKY